MSLTPELNDFLNAIRDDNRIGPVHISLFVAIMRYWNDNDCKEPIFVFSHELMKAAKISGIATYHKSIRELNDYKYIKYEPSFNHNKGSVIHITRRS